MLDAKEIVKEYLWPGALKYPLTKLLGYPGK